jgi:hypothetical protein
LWAAQVDKEAGAATAVTGTQRLTTLPGFRPSWAPRLNSYQRSYGTGESSVSLEDAVELAWGALRGEEVEEVIDKGGAN